MYRFFFLLSCLTILACNNTSAVNEKPGVDAEQNMTATPTTRLSEESELEIMAGCVDNAKANLGEAQAFALCRCILGQVQQRNPGADSTALLNFLNDTTQVKELAKNCQ